MTINFNEQWEAVIGGRVKFGLRGGELRLQLESGKIPYSSRELAGPLDLLIQKERQEQENNKLQSSVEASLSDTKPGMKANSSVERSVGRTDKFQFTSCQVTTKGAEESPTWVFEVKTKEPVLKGLLKNTKLGTLERLDLSKCCSLEAIFDVSLRDVQLTDAEGAWLKDLVPEQRAVLDRGLALLLLKKKLKPYMSRIKIQYV